MPRPIILKQNRRAAIEKFKVYRKQLEGGDAWGSYLSLCGMYGYSETLKRAGLPMSLEAETVKEIAAFVRKHAEVLKQKVGD